MLFKHIQYIETFMKKSWHLKQLLRLYVDLIGNLLDTNSYTFSNIANIVPQANAIDIRLNRKDLI